MELSKKRGNIKADGDETPQVPRPQNQQRNTLYRVSVDRIISPFDLDFHLTNKLQGQVQKKDLPAEQTDEA